MENQVTGFVTEGARNHREAPLQCLTSSAELAELCRALRAEGTDFIAIDTEFVRDKTYYSKLCLIQLATPAQVACIDPLAEPEIDLRPLAELLFEPNTTKVLHAAQQDLEIFYQLFDRVPAPVFDTQIAAALLGFGDQVSYAVLARELLGVNLDKNQTRTDWARRPLSEAQLRYAIDDVEYLQQFYPLLRSRLANRGRSDWLTADFAALSEPQRYRTEPASAWQRLKGLQRLRGVKLATAQRLAAWRETLAMAANSPRRWVLGDDALLALAQQAPRSEADLKRVRGLTDAVLRRHGDALLQCIEQAARLAPSEWPVLEQPPPLSSAQESIVDALVAIVKLRASEHDLSATSIAPRQALARLLDASLPEDAHPVLCGWRREIVGDDLLGFLRGEQRLTAKADRQSLLIVPEGG